MGCDSDLQRIESLRDDRLARLAAATRRLADDGRRALEPDDRAVVADRHLGHRLAGDDRRVAVAEAEEMVGVDGPARRGRQAQHLRARHPDGYLIRSLHDVFVAHEQIGLQRQWSSLCGVESHCRQHSAGLHHDDGKDQTVWVFLGGQVRSWQSRRSEPARGRGDRADRGGLELDTQRVGDEARIARRVRPPAHQEAGHIVVIGRGRTGRDAHGRRGRPGQVPGGRAQQSLADDRRILPLDAHRVVARARELRRRRHQRQTIEHEPHSLLGATRHGLQVQADGGLILGTRQIGAPGDIGERRQRVGSAAARHSRVWNWQRCVHWSEEQIGDALELQLHARAARVQARARYAAFEQPSLHGGAERTGDAAGVAQGHDGGRIDGGAAGCGAHAAGDQLRGQRLGGRRQRTQSAVARALHIQRAGEKNETILQLQRAVGRHQAVLCPQLAARRAAAGVDTFRPLERQRAHRQSTHGPGARQGAEEASEGCGVGRSVWMVALRLATGTAFELARSIDRAVTCQGVCRCGKRRQRAAERFGRRHAGQHTQLAGESERRRVGRQLVASSDGKSAAAAVRSQRLARTTASPVEAGPQLVGQNAAGRESARRHLAAERAMQARKSCARRAVVLLVRSRALHRATLSVLQQPVVGAVAVQHVGSHRRHSARLAQETRQSAQLAVEAAEIERARHGLVSGQRLQTARLLVRQLRAGRTVAERSAGRRAHG